MLYVACIVRANTLDFPVEDVNRADEKIYIWATVLIKVNKMLARGVLSNNISFDNVCPELRTRASVHSRNEVGKKSSAKCCFSEIGVNNS